MQAQAVQPKALPPKKSAQEQRRDVKLKRRREAEEEAAREEAAQQEEDKAAEAALCERSSFPAALYEDDFTAGQAGMPTHVHPCTPLHIRMHTDCAHTPRYACRP